jgi:hypothetical protein
MLDLHPALAYLAHVTVLAKHGVIMGSRPFGKHKGLTRVAA